MSGSPHGVLVSYAAVQPPPLLLGVKTRAEKLLGHDVYGVTGIAKKTMMLIVALKQDGSGGPALPPLIHFFSSLFVEFPANFTIEFG